MKESQQLQYIQMMYKMQALDKSLGSVSSTLISYGIKKQNLYKGLDLDVDFSMKVLNNLVIYLC